MNEQKCGRTRTGLRTVQVFSAKAKANDKTMSLWEFIEESKGLFFKNIDLFILIGG